MTSPDASDTNLPSLETVKPTLLILWSLALVGLLLAAIGVFDWSVFFVDGLARAELCGAVLAAITTSAWVAWQKGAAYLRPAIYIGLLAPLAAIAFLAFEGTSLVLCPNAFDFSMAWTPVSLPGFTGASLKTTELTTGFIAWALSLAFLSAMGTGGNRDQFLRWRHLATTSLVIAGCLALLFPVAGPTLGFLPLPPIAAGSESAAAAVPRTGFVCLPAVVAICVVLSQLREWRSLPASPTLGRFVPIGLAVLALLLELFAGRYSFASVGVSVVIVAAVYVSLKSYNSVFGALARVPTSVTLEPLASQSTPSGDPSRQVRFLLTVVFFFSGMAALVYQVVFAKGLALTFGSTSHASTIVLATYMGGLALGSWMGGRWAARLRRPVLGYAAAELGIAAICALAPLTLRAARSFYVHVAQGTNPSEPWLIALQLGIGAFILVPPTWLMGLTLPLLTRQFLDEKNGLGASAGLLYTANTLGAAVGASLTGYLVLPALGIGSSLRLAVLTNVIVAIFAIVSARIGRAETAEAAAPNPRADSTPDTTSLVGPSQLSNPRRVAWIATIQLAVGGFVTFGLETTFVHLLATVAGTSAYAFSLMLFAFLIGLSLGSSLGRKWLPEARHLPLALLLCQLVLAVTLLVACRFWDYLPAYFALFGRWSYTLTFAAREFVRFVVCLAVMLPPAICIGAQFPIAMEAVGLGWPNARLQALGRASAFNTVGNIAGALVIGFLALPHLGSNRTLVLLTAVCLSLSALAVWVLEKARRAVWACTVALVAGILFVQPPEFDLTRLCSGGNVYFKPQYYGRIIDHAESLDGGLTAVAIAYEGTRTPVKTLLTNGKFQGNDRRDSSGEVMAQTSFAIAPLLHTAARERSLVIGFGTGTTTRVLDEAGFRHVAVAELSGDIVELADRHFTTINGGVIHRPNVKVHVTDGRNFLLLDRHQHDLISIELSSIWFAGAANLYNDEFYALIDQRLSEHGVLQQWVQLHRLSHRDVMSILVTLRQRFPKVWLYFLGKQGILVACKHDCAPSQQTVQQLLTTQRLQTTLSVFNDGLMTVLRGRLLTPPGIDQLIEEYLRSSEQSANALLSTDDNLYLEYSTPKGNVRDYDESIADNEEFLARFGAKNPFDGTRLEPKVPR